MHKLARLVLTETQDAEDTSIRIVNAFKHPTRQTTESAFENK